MPFKAYDIRGRVPDQLNPDIAYRIGVAYGQVICPEGNMADRSLHQSRFARKAR